jgi:uncharacterized OB-fold protein
VSSAGDALLPIVDPEAAPFWEGARRGELCVPACPETGRLFFPPRARSPYAPRRAPLWVAVSGRGSIWSFAVPHPPLLPPFDALAPYPVVVVALAEDPRVRLVGNLVACPGGAINEVPAATLSIGAPVGVVFERVTDEIHLPRWRLEGSGGGR